MQNKDRYSGFEEMEIHETRGLDYLIRWHIGDSGIAVLSIHGGEIEPGTSQIAEAIAGDDHSFYTLEGVKDAGNRTLHITSTAFDEPTALAIVCYSEIIISVHGCADPKPLIHLGGLDQEVRERIGKKLCRAGFHVMDCQDPRFRAVDQRNICNLCGRGMGAQLEVSRGLRSEFFKDLSPEGRKYPTETFYRFVHAVRDAIEPFGGGFIQPEPENSTD
jgi:phage replication-related protein YjqB (UPF0714/DUF867 family)